MPKAKEIAEIIAVGHRLMTEEYLAGMIAEAIRQQRREAKAEAFDEALTCACAACFLRIQRVAALRGEKGRKWDGTERRKREERRVQQHPYYTHPQYELRKADRRKRNEARLVNQRKAGVKEGDEFWESVERTAAKVESWPPWRTGRVRRHILGCDENHEHHSPGCCAPNCQCRKAGAKERT